MSNVVRCEIRKTTPNELDEQPQFYWVAIAENNEIVGRGEEHPRDEDAARAAHSVFPHAAVTQERADGSKHLYTFDN